MENLFVNAFSSLALSSRVCVCVPGGGLGHGCRFKAVFIYIYLELYCPRGRSLADPFFTNLTGLENRKSMEKKKVTKPLKIT